MTDALLHPLATALDGTGRLVAAVTEEQWDLPTPCSDWTVRQLIDDYREKNPERLGVKHAKRLWPQLGQNSEPPRLVCCGSGVVIGYRGDDRVRGRPLE